MAWIIDVTSDMQRSFSEIFSVNETENFVLSTSSWLSRPGGCSGSDREGIGGMAFLNSCISLMMIEFCDLICDKNFFLKKNLTALLPVVLTSVSEASRFLGALIEYGSCLGIV